MRNKQRDELAKTAMHGILTACSSPQYVERLQHDASITSKGHVMDEIARRAYSVADSMIAEGKK